MREEPASPPRKMHRRAGPSSELEVEVPCQGAVLLRITFVFARTDDQAVVRTGTPLRLLRTEILRQHTPHRTPRRSPHPGTPHGRQHTAAQRLEAKRLLDRKNQRKAPAGRQQPNDGIAQLVERKRDGVTHPRPPLVGTGERIDEEGGFERMRS